MRLSCTHRLLHPFLCFRFSACISNKLQILDTPLRLACNYWRNLNNRVIPSCCTQNPGNLARVTRTSAPRNKHQLYNLTLGIAYLSVLKQLSSCHDCTVDCSCPHVLLREPPSSGRTPTPASWGHVPLSTPLLRATTSRPHGNTRYGGRE